MGFRDEDELRKVQAFDTLALPGLAAAWRPQACLGFADAVLMWLRAALAAAATRTAAIPRRARVRPERRDPEARAILFAHDDGAKRRRRGLRPFFKGQGRSPPRPCQPSPEMGAAAADESHTAGPGGRTAGRSGRPAAPRARASQGNRPNLCACFPTMKRLSKSAKPVSLGSRCRTRAAGRAASAAAGWRQLPCRRLRLPPRRAREEAASPGPVGHRCTNRLQPRATVAFCSEALANDGRHARSALDRGPLDWARCAGLRALGTAQRHNAIVCQEA